MREKQGTYFQILWATLRMRIFVNKAELEATVEVQPTVGQPGPIQVLRKSLGAPRRMMCVLGPRVDSRRPVGWLSPESRPKVTFV